MKKELKPLPTFVKVFVGVFIPMELIALTLGLISSYELGIPFSGIPLNSWHNIYEVMSS